MSAGAIWSACGMDLTSLVVSANSAGQGDGGAVLCASGSTGKDDSSAYDGNTAGGNGGAIAGTCSFAYTSVTFNNNAAQGNGGAFYLANTATATAAGLSFTQNSAGRSGGALASAGKITLTGATTFDRNNAKLFGGAIMVMSNGDVVINGGTFVSNAAPLGGSLASEASIGDAKLGLQGSTISTADAAAYADGGSSNCLFLTLRPLRCSPILCSDCRARRFYRLQQRRLADCLPLPRLRYPHQQEHRHL